MRRSRLTGCVLLVGLATAAAWAVNPTSRIPLRAPVYSFDLASPTIISMTSLDAGDALGHPGPVVVIPRENLGEASLLDELDGLSEQNQMFPPTSSFLLVFSVDRTSMGAVGPDPVLLANNLPFNVQTEAAANQQSGDAFLSTQLFDMFGPLSVLALSANNTLGRNQGDASGVDHSGLPATSPSFPNADSKDNVDAMYIPKPIAGGIAGVDPPPMNCLFFTLKRNSPSLLFLPGTNSGADVYRDFDVNSPAGQQLYVSWMQLGLQPMDDIASLLIFDRNGDCVYQPTDVVLFTLSRDSPTLGMMDESAATIFTNQGALAGFPAIYSVPAALGLDPGDHINALDFAPCSHAETCVLDWAIGFGRRVSGDVRCDGLVNNFDIDAFVPAILSRALYESLYPGCNYYAADINGDGLVNNFDIDRFVACILSPPPPGEGCP
ncbi:MAG: hypothetical protein HRU75_07220 [Planctomycetia bacterium]|nr:MAG: hypothetical protein HRU75_07220 [Planctomycetia bacterium]